MAAEGKMGRMGDGWCDFGVGGVGEYWKEHHKQSYEQAQEEFMSEVDPYVAYLEYPSEEDILLANMVFSEWLVFDYDAGGGKTPLALYAEMLLRQGDFERGSLLTQLAGTQLFSEYWVMWQGRDRGTSLLVDAFSKKRYQLVDDLVAHHESWANGLLGLRMAQIDGSWYFVGQLPFHDRYPRKEDYSDPSELVALHPEGVRALTSAEGVRYLDCARELLGVKGRFLSSVELNYL